jgi:hypothetical protein
MYKVIVSKEKNLTGRVNMVNAVEGQFFGGNTDEPVRTDIPVMFPWALRNDSDIGSIYNVTDLYLKHTKTGRPYYDIPLTDIRNLTSRFIQLKTKKKK